MKLHSIRALVVVAVVTWTVSALAVEPELDPTFGTGGIARIAILPGHLDTPRAVLIQPDQNILTAGISDAGGGGNWFIGRARHLSNGSADGTFGTGGSAGSRFEARDHANAIALQSDGKIVAVGMQAISSAFSDQTPSIYRFNTDGSVDTLFGDSGAKVGRWEPISCGEMSAVTVLPDGKILAAGRCNANANGGHNGLGFRRLLSDGSGDASYGSGGTVLHLMTAPGAGLLFTRPAVAFTPDFGALIAATVFRNGRIEFVVMQVDDNGDVVPIGGEGMLFPGLEINNSELSLVRFDDGSFLVACTVPRPASPGFSNFGVFRFDANGVLDPSFSEDGVVSIAISISPDVCEAITLAPDGKIMLAGRAGIGESALVRLLSDGTPDASFGNNGIAVLNMSQGAGSDFFTCMRFDEQQRLIAAGQDFSVGGGDFFIARFGASPTDVDGGTPSLAKVMLNAFPNPAGANVVFSFDLPEASQADLEIFDATGRRVATLTEPTQRAGRSEMQWNGRTTDGSAAPSGVYFARLAARGASGAVHRGSTKVIRLK